MLPKRKRSRSTRRDLPSEIIFEILSHLPPKVLVRFMLICKAWRSTICSQEFIKAQHDRSMKANTPRTILLVHPYEYFSLSVNFDKERFNKAVPPLRIKQPLSEGHASILGCCNGLVCIEYDNSISKAEDVESIVVWNPSIHRFKRIPFTAIELPADSMARSPRYGFGYDSTNDDYKLVRVVVFTTTNDDDDDDDEVGSEVKIYSLKSNTWKTIESLPCIKDLRMYYPHLSNLAFSNGALHWLMYYRSDVSMMRGVSLDLATEKYHEFPAPLVEYKHRKILWMLEVLDGHLCVYPRPSRFEGWYIKRSDVWIMKEYGETASWTRLYTSDMDDMPRGRYVYGKPLLLSKTQERVLLEVEGYVLFWYNIEKKRFRKVHISGKPSDFSTAICVGNLRLFDGDPVTLLSEEERRFQS